MTETSVKSIESDQVKGLAIGTHVRLAFPAALRLSFLLNELSERKTLQELKICSMSHDTTAALTSPGRQNMRYGILL